jgi:hypothetical protein
MTKTIIFIQAEGKPGVTEAEIMIPAMVRDLHETFKTHGIYVDKELEAFVDDADKPQIGLGGALVQFGNMFVPTL